MTLTEQTEMDAFLEEALATGSSDSPSHLSEPRSSSSRRRMESFASSRTTEL
jgi:hypothetical protein